jgi:hypothetical protein
MLVDVFNVPSAHGRVKERICKMLELCSTVRQSHVRGSRDLFRMTDPVCSYPPATASEIGLLWPWIVSDLHGLIP